MSDQTLPETIAVIGAGAMGCLFASRLAEAGAAVTVVDVDRGRLDAIGRNGIRLTDERGTRDIRVTASLATDINSVPGLVLLFTKSNHSAAAIRSIAHWQVARPLLLTLQNGIGNAELLAEAFGADRVLQGTAHVPADLQPPSGVSTHGFGHVHLGGLTQKAHQQAGPVRDLLAKAGFDVVLTPHVEKTMWEKVAFNAALNATAMISQKPNGGIDNPPGHRLAEAVVRETVAIAAARGMILNADQILITVYAALSEHSHHRPSMLQDRDHARLTEIEAINGAIVREGGRLGVAAPVCATLADLVRVIEWQEPNVPT